MALILLECPFDAVNSFWRFYCSKLQILLFGTMAWLIVLCLIGRLWINNFLAIKDFTYFIEQYFTSFALSLWGDIVPGRIEHCDRMIYVQVGSDINFVLHMCLCTYYVWSVYILCDDCVLKILLLRNSRDFLGRQHSVEIAEI